MPKSRVYQSPVANSIPFDNSTGKGYSSTNVQTALEELRDHTVYDSEYTTSTLNGTRTLTSTNTNLQFITGSQTGFSVALPDATTIPLSSLYQINNSSTQPISIKNSTGTLLFTLSQDSIGYIYLQTNITSAGVWDYWQVLTSSTATGIINYSLISSPAFTTSSQTYVVITGFTITPIAGTYVCMYNAETFYTTTPKTHFWSFFKAGTQITDSERSQDTAHSNQNMVDSTLTITQFNGVQTIDIRVKCDTTGSLTTNQRSIILIRLGP
jgi:hypothetical protein